MRTRVLKAAFGVLILGAGWIAWVAVSIWSFGTRDRSQRSDCAIVLGAAIGGDQPSPVFEERIKHAIRLQQQGIVGKIIFTGGVGEGDTHAESAVAAAYAEMAGVRPSAILVESQSKTTRENLVEAKKVMAEHGLRTAVIVSDPLHMRRALVMADDLGIVATSSPTPTTRYRSLSARLGFLLRETYFFHHYLIIGD